LASQRNLTFAEGYFRLIQNVEHLLRQFAKKQDAVVSKRHQIGLSITKFIWFLLLFSGISIIAPFVRADTQQCTSLTAYYCGGLSPSTPIGDRCLPRIKGLTASLVQIDTIMTSPLYKRLTFIVTHEAEGFHTYGNHCFNATVYARVDNYRVESAGGSSTMSALPWDAYAICATIGGSNCYSVTVSASNQQLKFWARAWQRSGQGYDECGCTSDTMIINNPIDLPLGSSFSLLIPNENELGPIPCQAQIGDPINVTNGNMYIVRNDVILGSDLGLPFTLSRHYNSYSFADPKAMGIGWCHSLEYELSIDTGSGDYYLTEPTGRQILINRYDLVQGATQQVRYSVPPGVPYRFTVDTSTGVCILARQDDTRLFFRNTGELDSLKDLSGNLTHLYYSDNNLDSIQYSSGRKLIFDYSDNALTNIFSSTGDTLVCYEYDSTGSLLRKATYADGSFEAYTYGDSAYDSYQVVAATTSDGISRHYTYDTSGLAVSYYLADGYEKVDLDWDLPSVQSPPCNPGPIPETTYCEVTIQNGLDTSIYGIIQPYDGSARRVVSRESADCSECATKYEYDANGMKKVVAYANGAVDSIWHDSRGNIIGLVLGANTSTKQRYTWGYDSTFNSPVYEQRASIGKTNDYDKLLFTYDVHGNITKLVETGWRNATNKFNDTSWYNYSAAGQLIKADGPRRDVADTVKYVYYGNGDLQYEILANGDTTEYGQRDELGHRTWIRSSAGDTTRFAFDVRGRMTGIVFKSGMSDSTRHLFTYNVDGDITSFTRTDGTGIAMYYSSAGYLDSIVDPLRSRYAYEYDSVGNRVSEKVYTDGGILRRQTTFRYDNQHQMIEVAGLYGDTTRYGYSSVGTVDTVWDGLSHQTISRIDSLRRVTEIIQPNAGDSIKTQYFYDKHDNVIKVIDPDGNQYVYKYDDKDRRIYDSCAVTGVTTYGYDAADNLVWEKNAAGDSISYSYDALNRLISVLFPDSQNIRYTYDGTEFPYGKGRLYMDSTAAGWVKYQYDSRGRVIREYRRIASDTAIYTTGYHYDKNGNIDTLTYPTGRMAAYDYDSTDNIIRVSLYSGGNWTVLADSIKYVPFGEAESWLLGNGIKLSVGLDSSYRVDSVSTMPDSISRILYTLDAADNIIGITNGLDSLANRGFVYDDVYRLIEARSRDYPDTLQRYIYSGNGNRDTVIFFTDSTVDTCVYSYANNRLTQVTGAHNLSLSYDALGNITQAIRGFDTKTFQYSDAGTLIGVNDGTIASYSYDGRLRRIKKVVAGSTVTKFIPGDDGRILTEYGETGGWDRDYVYLNGQLLARVGSAAGEGIQYVINDHLGTPMALVDSSKTIRWRAKWYPFGEIYDEFVSTDNDGRFPGQVCDDETGLYYNWHRYYSPQLGMYYQADPLGLQGGDYNLYRYANGSPTRFIDPYGLYSWNEAGYDLANFWIGVGDVASLGLTSWIRKQDWYGGDCFTDKSSGAYKAGEWAGFIASALAGLGGGARISLAREALVKSKGAIKAGLEFSHWIPKRILKRWGLNKLARKNTIWNGNYISPLKHTLNDPHRYGVNLKKLNLQKWDIFRSQWSRLPLPYRGLLFGSGYGGLGMWINKE